MFILSKPTGDEPIAPALLSYVARKLKNDFYHQVMDAFIKSGISQADLAKKLDADKGQLSRQLSAPGNWTIDTVAKMLFAINGHVFVPQTLDVDSRAPANMTQPTWLGATSRDSDSKKGIAKPVVPGTMAASATENRYMVSVVTKGKPDV